ncbi:MAG: flagellar protein FlaG [Treponema sp.]|nr:flagellar protein FlaG [Treponema sp.]
MAVSIPGNDERTVSEEREPDRVTAEITGTYNRRLQFVVDHNSSEVIVKVIDNATDEVVRVLPPEELQRLRSPQETMGSLLSERV